ncbi:peptidase S24/S26A/S26B/S26C [Phaeosphaeria sp. MPI-PUGE-AT-0046c]|nr:peptidase S24/S26A/S26B/S26C [Phaeosphaeria sp. MPI-PUGE-AT-0046c]
MAQRIKSPFAWGNVALGVGSFVLVVHVFDRYIGGIGRTHGISMLPTIPAGYRERPHILYSNLHRRGRWIQVGDVITYKHPIIAGVDGCKRVIGMPGDFVAVVTPGKRDDDLGKEDTEDKWATVKEQMIQVPEGHCWVAGDNLDWSRDSRLFGPLPLGLVKGKVLAVCWPPADAKWLGGKIDIKDVQEKEHEWISR